MKGFTLLVLHEDVTKAPLLACNRHEGRRSLISIEENAPNHMQQ